MTNTALAAGHLIPAVEGRDKVFIGGQWVQSSGDEWLEVIDPWTEQVAARVRAATVEDIDRAVAAARESFEAGRWRSRSPQQRAQVIDEIADRLDQRLELLAALGTIEVGITHATSVATQQYVIALMRGTAGHLRALSFREDRPRMDGNISRIVKEPTGVVAAIIPWNGPLGEVAFKLVNAIAAGCSVILKTAPETPLIVSVFADVIAELVDEGLMDAGVVSILAAGRETSEHLVAHSQVDHVSFTGSTAAGRRIMAVASERIAKVSLELGGKSAAIILDDADLEKVMQSLPFGGCMQSGQACVALTRVLVSRTRHDEVVEALKAGMAALTVGDPWAPTSVLGPLSMKRQRERVEGYIAGAIEDGAKVVLGGGRPADLEHGFFIEPTLLDGVSNDMRVAQEEVFGPVISVITYEDEDDAVRIANDSIYGLSGAVYTADVDHGYEVAGRLRTGVVSVNSATFDATVPFGGYKQSGNGREGGIEGLEEFLELKTIHMPA